MAYTVLYVILMKSSQARVHDNAPLIAESRSYRLRSTASVVLPCSPEVAFNYLDDQRNLSAHMGKRSWMMAGSKMELILDEAQGKSVGSEIVMAGSIMGISLSLREVIIERLPSARKVWESVGPQRLLVIDQYRMGFDLRSSAEGALLEVFIDYSLPQKGFGRILGKWLGPLYARWCTHKMSRDAYQHFLSKDGGH